MTDEERPPRMTKDELTAFVIGYCDGRIFTSYDVCVQGGGLIGLVFMPVAFGGFGGWTSDELKRIGILWEYMSAAGPLAANGMPTFFSLRIMHTDDWARARVAINTELERRRAIDV